MPNFLKGKETSFFVLEPDVIEKIKLDNSILKIIDESKPKILNIYNGKINQIRNLKEYRQY